MIATCSPMIREFCDTMSVGGLKKGEKGKAQIKLKKNERSE